MHSLIGIVVLPAIAWFLSSSRNNICWRPVIFGFLIQFSIGAFALFSPAGQLWFLKTSGVVRNLLDYSRSGIEFLFGSLANLDGPLGFIFAINVLPVVVFFSSLIAVLYHLGIMLWVVRVIGGALKRALATSHSESLAAATNIFVGQAEAPLVVRPFIPTMTISELFALMVGGMASIAGSVMAGYVALGIPLEYLLAASFMAAPGGLMMAKLMEPELETPADPKDSNSEVLKSYVNLIDAAATGALNGLRMAAAIAAMLIAFIALVALVNGLLGGLGNYFGYQSLTLEAILGVIFQPVAWFLGVPWSESHSAGSLIGQKLVLNEFVAYVSFQAVQTELSPKSQAIVIFALCGFANISSIAILLGGLGVLAPSRRADISRLGVRALIAATLANLMSASIAGFFLSIAGVL